MLSPAIPRFCRRLQARSWCCPDCHNSEVSWKPDSRPKRHTALSREAESRSRAPVAAAAPPLKLFIPAQVFFLWGIFFFSHVLVAFCFCWSLRPYSEANFSHLAKQAGGGWWWGVEKRERKHNVHGHTHKKLWRLRRTKTSLDAALFAGAQGQPRCVRGGSGAGGAGPGAGRSAGVPAGMWGTAAGRGRRDRHGKCQTAPDAHTHRRTHARKSPDGDKADRRALGRRRSRPRQTHQQSSTPNPPANPPGSAMRWVPPRRADPGVPHARARGAIPLGKVSLRWPWLWIPHPRANEALLVSWLRAAARLVCRHPGRTEASLGWRARSPSVSICHAPRAKGASEAGRAARAAGFCARHGRLSLLREVETFLAWEASLMLFLPPLFKGKAESFTGKWPVQVEEVMPVYTSWASRPSARSLTRGETDFPFTHFCGFRQAVRKRHVQPHSAWKKNQSQFLSSH